MGGPRSSDLAGYAGATLNSSLPYQRDTARRTSPACGPGHAKARSARVSSLRPWGRFGRTGVLCHLDRVLVAEDAKTAPMMIADTAECIDLLLTDVVLPGTGESWLTR